MAFPDQGTLKDRQVELEPILGAVTSDKQAAHEILAIVRRHRALLDWQLKGISDNYTSERSINKRWKRIAESDKGEGYLVHEMGRLVGQATILLNHPDDLVGLSAQIDYWIPDAEHRPQTGLTVGQLLIRRGFKVADNVHALLFDDESREPSVELKLLMDMVGEPTTEYMVGDPDRNAATDAEARLYIAKEVA